MLGLSSTSIIGSGSLIPSLICSTGSFVILILGFAFALCFALTGFVSSSKIVSTTASWTGS